MYNDDDYDEDDGDDDNNNNICMIIIHCLILNPLTQLISAPFLRAFKIPSH
jgi:hypothetical protein